MSCPTDGYNPVPDSDKPGRFADSPPVIVADFPGHSEISDPTETVERRLPSPAVSALRRKQLLPFYSRTPLLPLKVFRIVNKILPFFSS